MVVVVKTTINHGDQTIKAEVQESFRLLSENCLYILHMLSVSELFLTYTNPQKIQYPYDPDSFHEHVIHPNETPYKMLNENNRYNNIIASSF